MNVFPVFPCRYPTKIEQANKWLEAIRLHNETPIFGANGLICLKHFQRQEFQMRKGEIYKLVPGAIPSVFPALEKTIQISESNETPLSELSELSESPRLTTLDIDPSDPNGQSVEEIALIDSKDQSVHEEIVSSNPCDQCVHEDENATNVSYRFVSLHRRWREKTRYEKKKVNRLRATAKQLSQNISEMKKQQREDAELLKLLEVCRSDERYYSFLFD